METPVGGAAGRRVLDLLGLAARAGALVTGTDTVRQAARDERLHRVFLAEDAAPGQRQKLVPLLQARGVPSYSLFSRVELGSAAGRGPVSAMGIIDVNLARRAGELAEALTKSRSAVEP